MSTGSRSALQTSRPAASAGRTYAAALSALLAFAFIARAWELGRDSLWFDEAVSVGIARLPWHDFLHAWIAQVNSGLYYLLLRMLLPFGESEVFLRLTSVVCGVAAIAIFAEFSRRIFDRRVALLTAALLSFNVNACFYAREIRGYGLLLLLIALAWLVFERCLRDGRARWFVLWASLWIAAMYVHMFSVMVLGAQLCIALFATEFRERWRLFARSSLWIGFGYFPMAVMIYYSHREQIHWIPPLDAKTTNRFFLEFAGNSPWLLLLTTLLFAAACAIFVMSLRRATTQSERFALAAAVLGTIVPIALLGLLSVVKPAFIARYASQNVLPLALACAVAIAKFPKRAWLPALIVLGGLSVSAYRRLDLTPPAYEQRNDFRGAALFVGTHARPGDVIASWGPQSRYGLEYYRRRFRFSTFPSFVFPGNDSTPAAPEFAPLPEVKELDAISREHKHIWFFLDRNAPYEDLGIIPHFFLRRFGMGHRLASETHFRNGTLYEFEAE